MRSFFLFFALVSILIGCDQTGSNSFTYTTDFTSRDTAIWEIDSETVLGYDDLMGDGYMDIDAPQGATVWFKEKLERPVEITFDVTVVEEGGPNDRASDLNCFWMATDPSFPDRFFKREASTSGKFWDYYSLNLYYVGLGGHENTKTRFRKYNGTATPVPEVIREYTDPEYLIHPNEKSEVRIVCLKNLTQYYYNGTMLFELEEEDPYSSGYFGFRTVENHMRIHSFSIKIP